ncbi:hypothetical protein Tco_0778564, partial [Tanacetum coccineum]
VRIRQRSQENRQNTGKHGHGKRKITREAKDSKTKPEKVKLQSSMGQQSQLTRRQNPKMVKMENSSDQEQDGKDKSVKSSSLIGSLMPRGLKEAQEMMMFALDHSHNEHKGHIKDCQLGNPCDPKERSNGSKSLPND